MAILRAARCSVCGRDIRGMEDARKEGGRWFCSPSCLLQGTGGQWKKRERTGPVRAVRRVVKWTLIVLGLLFAGIIALALALGTKGTRKAGSGMGFGSRSQPVRLGKAAVIGGGWRVKVLRVVPKADRRIVSTKNKYGEKPNKPPPPGAQDYMVKLAVTYIGGGKGNLGTLATLGIHAMGKHNADYDTGLFGEACGSALPKPNFLYAGNVFSGRTVRGNVCFQIAKNDAHTLNLYTGNATNAQLHLLPAGIKRVWFALR